MTRQKGKGNMRKASEVLNDITEQAHEKLLLVRELFENDDFICVGGHDRPSMTDAIKAVLDENILAREKAMEALGGFTKDN